MFIAYIPQLLGALAIVAAGVVLGIFARQGAIFVLRRLRFNEACERFGVTTLMQESGIQRSPTQFAGAVVFYAIILFAVLAALGPLGLEFLATTLNQILLYAPRLLVAALLVVLGTSAARLVSELAARGLANAGVGRTEPFKVLVRASVIFVSVVLALSVLGIEVTILIVLTIIVFGGASLAAALALGLGLRKFSQNIAAGRYISEGVEEGDSVTVGGYSGTVESIGYAMTILRDPASGNAYLLPNSYFLENVVEKTERDLDAPDL